MDRKTQKQRRAEKRELQVAFLRSREGMIFLVGCLLLLLWVGIAAAMWRFGSVHWDEVMTVGFAHLLAGRAISIARGTQVGLPKWAITVIATYADVVGMLIVFPLFVYSYEHWFEGQFFQKRMRPMLESAQKRVHRYRESKIIGVFFFVWLPLWMTGIIIGAILGYLLGLRRWITMLTAGLGALAAVATWVYAYDILFRGLARIHQEIPLVVTVLLIAGLLVYRAARKRREAGTR